MSVLDTLVLLCLVLEYDDLLGLTLLDDLARNFCLYGIAAFDLVAVYRQDRVELYFRSRFSRQLLDFDNVAFADFVLLAARNDYCLKYPSRAVHLVL